MVVAFGAGSLALSLPPAPAAAHDELTVGKRSMAARKSHQRRAERSDRRSADEREYDRARADNYDPAGSYAAYPDWARYALSPKGQR